MLKYAMCKSASVVAVATLVAVPAVAADIAVYEPAPLPTAIPQYSTHLITGHLELGLGAVGYSGQGSDTLGLFEGAGRFNLNWNQNWNVQFDLNAASVFDHDYSEAAVTPLTHLWYGTQTYAAGVFGGATLGLYDTIWLGGIEGEVYFTNTALGGQLSYLDFESGSAWNARGWIKYYINPDLKIDGDLFYTDASGGWGDEWGISAGVEKRHTGEPYSGFARIGYRDYDYGDAWTGLVGFRLFADAPGSTLYSHDMQVPWDYQIPFTNVGNVRRR